MRVIIGIVELNFKYSSILRFRWISLMEVMPVVKSGVGTLKRSSSNWRALEKSPNSFPLWLCNVMGSDVPFLLSSSCTA